MTNSSVGFGGENTGIARRYLDWSIVRTICLVRIPDGNMSLHLRRNGMFEGQNSLRWVS